MTKNYLFILLVFVSVSLFAQETLTFSGYDGAGMTVTANSATINDEITIVFEDADIINNFYSENQNSIYMFLGLQTSAGTFQGTPGDFADLSWQPVLNLTDGDAANSPNTYSITFTPGALFPGLVDTNIEGINFLFQNQFGGGGNNQTTDLFIDLVDANLSNSTLSINQNENPDVKAFYTNENLVISGVHDTVSITVHNLLGKKVAELNKLMISGSYTAALPLTKNNIYIVSVSGSHFTNTFKMVAK